jgi:hypothetical protein
MCKEKSSKPFWSCTRFIFRINHSILSRYMCKISKNSPLGKITWLFPFEPLFNIGGGWLCTAYQGQGLLFGLVYRPRNIVICFHLSTGFQGFKFPTITAMARISGIDIYVLYTTHVICFRLTTQASKGSNSLQNKVHTCMLGGSL